MIKQFVRCNIIVAQSVSCIFSNLYKAMGEKSPHMITKLLMITSINLKTYILHMLYFSRYSEISLTGVQMILYIGSQ